MRVLLTGSTGYLGEHVLRAFEGDDVTTVDTRNDFSVDLTQFDCCIHLAWVAKAGDGDPDGQRSCSRWTNHFGLAIKRTGMRVVFASTASVYGARNGDMEMIETDPVDPNCEYTRAKVAAERSLRHHLGGDRLAVLRFGSLMGRGVTRTRTDLVVNAFASDAYAGRTVEVWNPDAWKPVVHVRDAAGIVVAAAREAWSGTYNVASRCLRAREIAELARLQTGCEVREVLGSPNGLRSCRVSNAKVEAQLSGILWREVPEAIAEFRSDTSSESYCR